MLKAWHLKFGIQSLAPSRFDKWLSGSPYRSRSVIESQNLKRLILSLYLACTGFCRAV